MHMAAEIQSLCADTVVPFSKLHWLVDAYLALSPEAQRVLDDYLKLFAPAVQESTPPTDQRFHVTRSVRLVPYDHTHAQS